MSRSMLQVGSFEYYNPYTAQRALLKTVLKIAVSEFIVLTLDKQTYMFLGFEHVRELSGTSLRLTRALLYILLRIGLRCKRVRLRSPKRDPFRNLLKLTFLFMRFGPVRDILKDLKLTTWYECRAHESAAYVPARSQGALQWSWTPDVTDGHPKGTQLSGRNRSHQRRYA